MTITNMLKLLKEFFSIGSIKSGVANRKHLNAEQKPIDKFEAISIDYKKKADTYLDCGCWADATSGYLQAIAINPDFFEAHVCVAIAFGEQHQFAAAERHLRQAISINPQAFAPHYNLSTIAFKLGNLDEAVEQCRIAVSLQPDRALAYERLGFLLQLQWSIQESIDSFRKAILIDPLVANMRSSLLWTLQYDDNLTQADLSAEHFLFAEHFETPLVKTRKPYANDLSPVRRLRIGYVSSDFRRHSVALFMLPIFAHHDKEKIEIFCYYSFDEQDEITSQISALVDHFIVCAMMSDDELSEQIRYDCIDILVDLGGHTAHNRLLVFARKPAPIQISYLGYVDTTGLSSMDYRLTNFDADPQGNDNYYSEKLYRFRDHLWWSFRPALNLPKVSRLPALLNGYVTFVSCNQIAKISSTMIDAWGKILHSVPLSRLVIMGIQSELTRLFIQRRFEAYGIASTRLIFHSHLPLEDYRDIVMKTDISLDTFPFNGGTTTCETLWLGIPVITMMGKRFASRVGYAILKEIDLEELVAVNYEEYVNISINLANNLERLSEIRFGMRERLAMSSLSDEKGFTRNLEIAYRDMWTTYISQQ
jgi:predicted O-linked N-acetylglucosamine transferase (SPINDLY family)